MWGGCHELVFWTVPSIWFCNIVGSGKLLTDRENQEHRGKEQARWKIGFVRRATIVGRDAKNAVLRSADRYIHALGL